MRDNVSHSRPPNVAHGAYRLGEHIAFVEKTAGLAAHGEGLTGWTASDEIEIGMYFIVEFSDVAFGDIRPMTYRRDALTLVVTQRLASMRIPLDDGAMIDRMMREPEGEAAGAGKQFDRAERH